MIKKVAFTSRIVAESMDGIDQVAVISITDKKENPAKLKEGWLNILRLSFHDIDKPIPGYQLFSLEDAMRICQFLKEVKPNRVLVHCEAGISRSAGIATAIQQFFGSNVLKRNELYNRHVFAVMTKALFFSFKQE